METKRNATFIIGALFVALFMVTALLWKSTISKNKKDGENNSLVVETQDLLVSKNLSESDLLPEDAPIVTFIDPQRGAASSTVLLVEFSDFACPFCRDVQESIEKILTKYPNDVRHVWKDAPNENLHEESFKAHIAARCAGREGKFWEYHDALFKSIVLSDSTLTSIAQNIGLNMTSWQKCLENNEERAKVERGLLEAQVLGVDGTPYFFINGKSLGGAINFETMDAAILSEINKPQ